MNYLQRLWHWPAPPVKTAALDVSVDGDSLGRPALSEGNHAADAIDSNAAATLEVDDNSSPPVINGDRGKKPSFVSQLFLHDILYIAMLVMALTGVVLRLSVIYWVILTPIFGIISIAEGWRHFPTRGERVGFAYRTGAIWFALLVCIYLLYVSSVQGVMNLNSLSLAMLTLLALGTFVAGVQARVWQISGVGAVLFLAVPAVGWLDQSPLLLTAAVCAIVALGGAVWWIKHVQSRSAAEAKSPGNSSSVAPLHDA